MHGCESHLEGCMLFRGMERNRHGIFREILKLGTVIKHALTQCLEYHHQEVMLRAFIYNYFQREVCTVARINHVSNIVMGQGHPMLYSFSRFFLCKLILLSLCGLPDLEPSYIYLCLIACMNHIFAVIASCSFLSQAV